MTLTLEIASDLVDALRVIAEEEGVEPDQYIARMLQEHVERRRKLPPHVAREEAALFQQINQGLPESTWERYRALKRKRDDEALTPPEHAELVALTDDIEGWNVRRLEIVAELAKSRRVGLREMMKQLGLLPRPNA